MNIFTIKNHNVMNKKNYFEAPQAELIMVRFEGNFCATGKYGDEGAAGNKLTSGGTFEFDDED